MSIVRERVDRALWKEIVLPSLSWKKTGKKHLKEKSAITAPIEAKRLPRHVGLIMDGNGRWAEARGLPRSAGHREGVRALQEIVRTCGQLGIPVLTVYCFSTENWYRPQEEINFLMNLLIEVLREELDTLDKEGVRIVPIGKLEDLPTAVRKQVEQAAEVTAGNDLLKLNMAISYGSRLEIINAVRQLMEEATHTQSVMIDEKTLERYLYTAGDPELDLIIRTGGERRLSNFLLWQGAYAELYFSDIMWPDFTPEDFMMAIVEYQKRAKILVEYQESKGAGQEFMSSLAKRVLTAALFIPIVLGCLYWDGLAFLIFVLAASLVAMFELRIMLQQINGPIPGAFLYLLTAGILVMIYWQQERVIAPLMLTIFVVVAIRELASPQVQPFRRGGLTVLALFYGAILPGHFLLIRSEPQGFALLLMVVLGTWAADTGAYFIGIRWGRHKLAPRISPKKSIEGACGGVLLAMVVTHYVNNRLQLGLMPGWFIGLVIGSTAVIGDLFESALKREAGVKDSGWILPGHGGVLDRIDSLLFTVPVIYYLVRWMG